MEGHCMSHRFFQIGLFFILNLYFSVNNLYFPFTIYVEKLFDRYRTVFPHIW